MRFGSIPIRFRRKRSLSQGMSVGDDDEEFLARQFGDKRPIRSSQQSSMNKDDAKTDEEVTSKPHGDSKSFEDSELVPGPPGPEDPSFYEEDEEPADLLHLSFSDFIVDPTGDLYYCWQGLVGVSVFYNIIFTVMRIAFEQLDSYWWLFWALDLLTDLVYAADMFVQMNISYIDDGIYVTDKKQLKEHYLNTRRFTFDAVSILPLPYATLGIRLIYWLFRTLIGMTDFGLTVPVGEMTLIGFCRLPRIAKFRALSEFLAAMESRTNAPDTFRAFNLIVCLLLIIHWIACVYYCISWYEGFGVNTWVYPATEEGDDDHLFLRKYTVCFYWSFLTLTTIGGGSDPETNLEFLFTGLTFFNGVFVFAAVVGNVGDVISNMHAARTEFQAKVDDIKRYMLHHRVPDPLQKRVKKWFDYNWGRTHGVDETSLLETLPDKLRARIQIQIHLKTLKKVTIFENCENGLLCELVLKLRPQIYSPRDYVCKRNEIGKEMYIINHGKLECIVTTESGERIVVATLTEGKYFGEIALLSFEGNNRRTADVRSVGYSELLVLSKKALMSALVDYPEARKQLEYQAQLRISSNRKMSHALKETSSHSHSSIKTRRSERTLLKSSICNNVGTDPECHSGSSAGKKGRGAGGEQTRGNGPIDPGTKTQISELQKIVTELKNFDCLATRERIVEMERTIAELRATIAARSAEHEEALSKLAALHRLHLLQEGSPPPPQPPQPPLTNGHHNHSTGCSSSLELSQRSPTGNHHQSGVSRTEKLRSLTERIAQIDRSPGLEEGVSERTKRVLETMERERQRAAVPRQRALPDEVEGDGPERGVAAAAAGLGKTVVQKYLKQQDEREKKTFRRMDSTAVSRTAPRSSGRPRHPHFLYSKSNRQPTKDADDEEGSHTPSLSPTVESPTQPDPPNITTATSLRRLRRENSTIAATTTPMNSSRDQNTSSGSRDHHVAPAGSSRDHHVATAGSSGDHHVATAGPSRDHHVTPSSSMTIAPADRRSSDHDTNSRRSSLHIDNLISACDLPYDNDIRKSFDSVLSSAPTPRARIRGLPDRESIFSGSMADYEDSDTISMTDEESTATTNSSL